jgi:hypothetical protein
MQPHPGVIAALVMIALCIAYFNQPSSSTKSPEQIEFENWVQKLEVKQQDGIPLENIPSLTLRLYSIDNPNSYRDLNVTGSNSKIHGDRVLRLLQIGREAGLFSIGKSFATDLSTEAVSQQTSQQTTNGANTEPSLTTPREGDIIFKIVGQNKLMTLNFNRAAITGKIQAELFLKLFEEFSKLNSLPAEQAANSDHDVRSHNIMSGTLESLPKEVQDIINSVTK